MCGIGKICIAGNRSFHVTGSDFQSAQLVTDGKGFVLLSHIRAILVCTGQGAGKLTPPSGTKLAVMFSKKKDICLHAD